MTERCSYAARYINRGQVSASATAFAPANIALCKYWGKRNRTLNLPLTSSLSVSLGTHGTTTTIEFSEHDTLTLNEKQIGLESTNASARAFAERLWEYIDLFREPGECLAVRTSNTIPTAAGLASSASGFAACTKALNDLFGCQADDAALSRLARLGSGSACRSLWHGFARWNAGVREDGDDCYAEPFGSDWPDLRLAVCPVDTSQKPVSSRDAMNATVANSPLFRGWEACVTRDLCAIETSIINQDFERLGKTAERNALAMHATMLGCETPILYWLPATVDAIHQAARLRADGIPIYVTIDAGPNPKLLYQQQHEAVIAAQWPDAMLITPWSA